VNEKGSREAAFFMFAILAEGESTRVDILTNGSIPPFRKQKKPANQKS
jgi:hypothetical protein